MKKAERQEARGAYNPGEFPELLEKALDSLDACSDWLILHAEHTARCHAAMNARKVPCECGLNTLLESLA